jgi:hypothetical protein
MKDGAGGKTEGRQTVQDHTAETSLGTDARICSEAGGIRDAREREGGERRKTKWRGERLLTNVKRVVVA